MKRLKFSQLINLEIQLLKDAEADPLEIRLRDREIGRKLHDSGSSITGLFLHWLKLAGGENARKPGDMYNTGMHLLAYILFFSGLATGLSAGSAVLHFDGTQPVNIVNFLALFLGVQFLTYLLFLLNCLPERIKKTLPFLGDFYDFLRQIALLISQSSSRILDRIGAEQTHLFFERLQRIRLRHKLYLNIEKWLLIRLSQTFSLAFNLGALLICLYLIVFSDLAFAWNTTLDLPDKSFHRLTTMVSQPWHKIMPEAVPDLALVEKTRFSRLEGTYLNAPKNKRAADLNSPGDWWPFLILALFFYGFLPRLIIYCFSLWRFHANLQKVSLKTVHFAALYERLIMPLVQTRAGSSENIDSQSRKLKDDSTVANKAAAEVCKIILWGEPQLPVDQIQALVYKRFGCENYTTLEAGTFESRKDDLTLQQLAKVTGKNELVLILVESWETPGKAIYHFVQRLREQLPEKQ